MATSSKTYVVDFKHIFSVMGKDIDEFYFYPGDIHGFIESCVLATQRDTDPETRNRYIMNDLLGAKEAWAQKEEDHYARASGGWINGKSVQHYSALNVLLIAEAINAFVYNSMALLYQVHGQLAISSKSLKWTPANALAINVSF